MQSTKRKSKMHYISIQIHLELFFKKKRLLWHHQFQNEAKMTDPNLVLDQNY